MRLPAIQELRLKIFNGLIPTPQPSSQFASRPSIPTLRKLHADTPTARGWWPAIEPLLKVSNNIKSLSLSHIQGFVNEPLDGLQNLVELTLDSCDFKILALSELIESAPHLKAFRMCGSFEGSHEHEPPIYPNPFPCYASIVTELGKHQSTLRSLCLAMKVRGHGHRPNPGLKGVDLRGFKNLENLCVRLIDLRCRDPERVGEILYEIAQNLKSLEPSDPRCQDGYLASILPSSIKRLYLIDGLNPKNGVAVVSANLWGLDTALKMGDFPNLEEVAIPDAIWARTMSNPTMVSRGARPCPAAAGRLRMLGRMWAERGGPKLIDTPPVEIILDNWH
jgi:hypothetical protein